MSGELAPAAPQRSVVQSRGLELALWTWHPAESVKGTVVVFHGLGAHARFPSVALAAELLVQKSYRVCAVDFPGHGKEDGYVVICCNIMIYNEGRAHPISPSRGLLWHLC